jgi:hypothetical protein
MAGTKPGPDKGDPRASINGKKGAAAARAEHGVELYTRAGKLGGQATKEKHGEEHYRAIGQKGAASRKAKKEAARARGEG